MHKNPLLFFTEKLQIWYKTFKRDLPWRETTDPYKIWLSEIILQQTRVAQGLPYYLKFVESFPKVINFANAQEDEVLRLWQGLGYYSRARNMHATSKIVVAQFGGQFPKNYTDLLKLKGIGTYTAAAIASFANNEKVAVVDGNVYRVLSRIFGLEADISSPNGKKVFTELANKLLPDNNYAVHNQAIMEFGALQCTPKSPNCELCPFIDICIAFKNNTQSTLPVNLKKLKIINRYFYYCVVEFDGKIFMKKREGKGIWQGLFDFLLIEKDIPTEIEDVLVDSQLKNSAVINAISNVYVHKLTHQNLSITFIHLKIKNSDHQFVIENTSNFYSFSEIEVLPKPIVIANFIANELFGNT